MEKVVSYTHKDIDGAAIAANAIVVTESAPAVHDGQPNGLVLVLVATDGTQDASALSQAELAAGHPMVRRLAARSPTPGQAMCVHDPAASAPLQATLDWLDWYRVNVVGIGA